MCGWGGVLFCAGVRCLKLGLFEVFLWGTTGNGNCNGKTFIYGGHGEGQRQNLYPRRAAKDHEEGQGQHLFVREGARRTATATSFVHEGPL